MKKKSVINKEKSIYTCIYKYTLVQTLVFFLIDIVTDLCKIINRKKSGVLINNYYWNAEGDLEKKCNIPNVNDCHITLWHEKVPGN